MGLEAAIKVAETLRDASYMIRIKDDKDSIRLSKTEGFRKSLQREHGAIRAFLEGWKLFGDSGIVISNQTFTFESVTGELMPIELIFSSERPLPHDINVVIGANGIGKSRLMHQVVTVWLESNPDAKSEIGFKEPPSLNQLVVVSYSPFELFRMQES